MGPPSIFASLLIANLPRLAVGAGGLVLLGSAGYLLLALHAVAAWRPPPSAPVPRGLSVCVLKPLCGHEPGLETALESFLTQEVGAADLSFVFGVTSVADPAYLLAHRVIARHGDVRARVVVDPTVHGANPKVSNLINMQRNVSADVWVVSDSDVVIRAGDLERLLGAMTTASVGAVTALFRGRPGPGTGGVAVEGALYIDGWFLPTAILHARLAGSQVCYGPMTAIRSHVLADAGGFPALADCLADDTELGRMTRAQGLEVVIAPVVAETLVQETRLHDLLEHELRWARTIRALQPRGYVASIFMHPGPLSLVMLAMRPSLAWAAVLLLLVMMRWALVTLTRARFGRAHGLPPAGPLRLWWREQLYFGVWLVGFFGRRIRWRGAALEIAPGAMLHPSSPLEPVVERVA